MKGVATLASTVDYYTVEVTEQVQVQFGIMTPNAAEALSSIYFHNRQLPGESPHQRCYCTYYRGNLHCEDGGQGN